MGLVIKGWQLCLITSKYKTRQTRQSQFLIIKFIFIFLFFLECIFTFHSDSLDNASGAMELSTDPYELKLFQMFQSCDKGECGLLDEEALRRLCGLLELQDQGTVLINDLSGDGRVSFDRFKEALLKFLGTELDATEQRRTDAEAHLNINYEVTKGKATTSVPIVKNCERKALQERTLVICDTLGTHEGSMIHSSDSDDDTDINEQEHRRCDAHIYGLSHVQRSSSQTDIPGNRRCRTLTANGGGKLKRCSSLPTQRNLQHQLKCGLKSKSNKQKSQFPKDTLLSSPKHRQQNPINSSLESLDFPDLLHKFSINQILEIWENANISNGKSILLALGFDEDEVTVSQLSKVLEEELRGLEDDTQQIFVRAFFALQTAELSSLRKTVRQMYDENKKLHVSNKDVNNRLALLAAEIDERHASLEETSKKEIRSLEQRHATVVRELTTCMSNDRENWSNFTSRLEENIKKLEEEEIKIKTELELVQRENVDLEGEHQKLQKQITDLLEKNIQLNKKLADRDSHGNEMREQHGDKNAHDEEVMQLVDKISNLQMENKGLRDKIDELVVELENINLELTRAKLNNKKNIPASSFTSVVELNGTELEDVELAAILTATKRRGDSPSKIHITEESPRMGKLRKCINKLIASEASETSEEWVALNSELRDPGTNKITSTTIIANYLEEIATLKKTISELETKQKQRAADCASPEDRCKELESSLEQMQRAYEDCEDYWQSKLAEERHLFEKERQIYEEEQHESDKKFTELVEKVREYEEQFSKDGRLSPIEEKDLLEQQYLELEAESNEIREVARKMFEDKSNEIEALQREIEDLRLRLGESVEILTGACQMKNEAIAASALHINAEKQSSASSPISYLWHQSTIQEPAKNYASTYSAPQSPSGQPNRNNLTTSETSIFSTTPVETISPIQKPTSSKISESDTDDVSSTSSDKSFKSHSLGSTHSAYQNQTLAKTQAAKSSSLENNVSTLGMKEELKRLKFFEISLRDQVKDLSLQRDGLVMELQQLQEARPVLEKAYARTTHPNLMQRVNQLELRNRHLQNVIKQQQQQTESLMQRSWQQHQMELVELHGRIETQGSLIGEQAQRLQNADLLVKDLYVENSHLAATVQRLEQHRTRINIIHQQQHHGFNGLPGMP